MKWIPLYLSALGGFETCWCVISVIDNEPFFAVMNLLLALISFFFAYISQSQKGVFE